MAFEAFAHKRAAGAFHQRRAIAYAAATCALVGLGIASASLRSKELEPPPKEPDPIDVQLEEKIEEEKPKEPEPTLPTPSVALIVPSRVKISPEPPPLVAPPPDPNAKTNLDEADPSKDKGVAGDPNGDPAGNGKGALPSGPPKKVDPPPSAPTAPVIVVAPRATGAVAAENDLPAKGISTPPPSYPESARAAGLTGVVIVKLTIDETGKVVSVKIVKGDPNFDEAVLKTVLGWKYAPARHPDGSAFLSVKTVKIPFRLKS